MSLPLHDVRLAAARFGGREIYLNETSRVISSLFASEGGTRVNVHYTTSTVGTCLNHPKQGKTQLFRRHVSLSELEAIFRNPRVHTGKGYQTKPAPISSSGGRAGGGGSSSNSGGGGAAATVSAESRPADLETEVKSQLQRVEEEMQEPAQEKAHVIRILDQLEEAKKKKEEEEASRKRKLKEEEASRKKRLGRGRREEEGTS